MSVEDSFKAHNRIRRMNTPGLVVFIDVQNLSCAVARYRNPGCHQLGKSQWHDKINKSRDDILTDNLLAEIVGASKIEGSSRCLVDAYAVSLRGVSPVTNCLKFKLTVGGPHKSIDDSVLIRLFTEELTALRLANATSQRTFALVAGDGDYYDIVRTALRSGCNVELWFVDGKSVNSAYRALENRFKSRSNGNGIFRMMDLTNWIRGLSTNRVPRPLRFRTE